jgi:hypothetical protein
MKDLYEVLRQKQLDIERVQKEIAALQFVVPLLADAGDKLASLFRPGSNAFENKAMTKGPYGH